MNKSPPSNCDPNAETLKGTIQSVLHQNEQNGFLIAKVALEEVSAYGQQVVVIKGTCPVAWPGETIRCSGHWMRHPVHGLQFEAASISCIEPTSAEGIIHYLSSGIFKGIGPNFAKRIVDRFGADTLRILEKESGRLAEVPGIGKARARQLKKAFAENEDTREIMLFLQGHGITTAMSTKIYKRYGEHTIARVKHNPYQLCVDVDGIGFRKADEIAGKLGIPKDSPYRARAGIHYTLQELANEGHCFCETQNLLLQAADKLSIEMAIIQEALAGELADNHLVDDGGRIYLNYLHRAERSVAARLITLIDTRDPFPAIKADAAIDWVAGKLSFRLAPLQSQAVSMALTNKVSVITGGPGVGKTTIVRALCLIWGAKGRSIRLLAPTGRAAHRLSESTGLQAQTIHRLLKYLPNEHRFTYHAENPVHADTFVIDESSMLDIELAASLLAAIPPTSSLVIVGDVDQLPSVGPGNVLRDIIDSKIVPVTRLDEIFRQKQDSGIVQNAHRVNHGLPFVSPPPGSPPFPDFFFVPCETPEQISDSVTRLICDRIPRKFNLDPQKDIQLLSPMRQGAIGIDTYNDILQAKLNPVRSGIRYGIHEYRRGDRVMQRRNDYDKNVFNGDVGFIQDIDLRSQTLSIAFDDRVIAYTAAELADIDLAYATTIHKSQGSEYPAVVVVMSYHAYTLLQRNLLYTAITRGKKLVCIVGDPKAISTAIRTTDPLQRQTALALRLQHANHLPANQIVAENK